MLNGIARMSEDALSRARRINALLEQWRRKLTGGRSRTPAALVDLLAENPYWTAKKTSERLDIAFTTAQRTIDKLQALDILHQVGDAKRGRVYCANPIMAILDEPPGYLGTRLSGDGWAR